MSSYSLNANNSLQTCNGLDGLNSKNRKCTKYVKKVVARNLESDASKNKLFNRCDDKSCDNIFID
jgi:hypothetical protein